MTDAHCHVSCEDPSVRELLIGRDFFGTHPWEAEKPFDCSSVRERLLADPRFGVGEIGLDRLKSRDVSPRMREVFESQLRLAFELRRPVVLHGAKCWGQVVRTISDLRSQISNRSNLQIASRSLLQGSNRSNLLFHGFSRSDGLIPDIVKLNGYISVGPAVLNDHAVNYRELVKKIPADRLLVETDRTPENAATCPSVRDVLAKTAELRGLSAAELERITDANAEAFLGRQRTLP